ncbi:winged helix-turn-helix transcriptional regulator [Lactococcus insecticola]|uniref:MarR family transcriptional regulator n=1 Tax=Pseudolactococcus insecticola TaxID=2709158 RepID=A0A6A0B522_9LACT|nr:helix-turn-helix domain-containing protein [Lactococcus insecticola]GFH40106.1 MarR family transcriptional regulator [Lactococcus insecticola]
MTEKYAYNCAQGCPVESTLQFISGKWKSVILYHLIHQDFVHYGDLKRLIPGVTSRMLSLQLSDLVRDGIIDKHIIQSYPVKNIEYHLTPLGQSLIPVIEALASWGESFNAQAKIASR